MKKVLIMINTIVLISLIAFLPTILAKETQMRFFGVGADVKVGNQGEYTIVTKGEKAEEGFVHTATEKFSKKEIKFKVELKGQDKVLLKIQETDARGRFIKEEKQAIELTQDWKLYEVPFVLVSLESQIDVLVVTESQRQTEFQFKNLLVGSK